MATKRIGELLGQVVPLNPHDIEEILEVQSAAPTRKSFGDIAISMGLCRPEHVLKAWAGQLHDGPPREVDIDRIGVDTQALTHVSASTAHDLRVVPLRVLGDVLIVAIASDSIGLAATQLPKRVSRELRFVIAKPAAINRALEKHYPAVEA